MEYTYSTFHNLGVLIYFAYLPKYATFYFQLMLHANIDFHNPESLILWYFCKYDAKTHNPHKSIKVLIFVEALYSTFLNLCVKAQLATVGWARRNTHNCKLAHTVNKPVWPEST